MNRMENDFYLNASYNGVLQRDEYVISNEFYTNFYNNPSKLIDTYNNLNNFNPQNINRKVLVNPHFKTQVFINPHFEKKSLTNTQHSSGDIKQLQVHINPHFDRKIFNTENKSRQETNKKPLIHINPKLFNSITTQSNTFSAQANSSSKLINSTAQINFSSTQSSVASNVQNVQRTISNMNSNPTLKSKLKVIHSSTHKLIKRPEKMSKPSKNLQIIHSTPHRLIKSSKQFSKTQKILHSSPHKLINYSNKLSKLNTPLSRNTKSPTLVKLTPNKLVKIKHNAFIMTPKISVGDFKQSDMRIINKSAYKLDRTRKLSVKLVPKQDANVKQKLSSTVITEYKLDRRAKTNPKLKTPKLKYKIDRRNIVIKKQSSKANYKWSKTTTKMTKDKLVNTSNSLAKSWSTINRSRKYSLKTNTPKRVLSHMRQKSIVALTNKLRKNNQPCPFFRRFGKCKGKENGTCRRIHDSKKVTICAKFLKGECNISDCSLSHEVGPEKMPTCRFFLEGFCSRENCPYLHVKLNEKADICKDFLDGYCLLANKCNKRHMFICPDFERNGECKRCFCPYPHKKQTLEKEAPSKQDDVSFKCIKTKEHNTPCDFFVDTGDKKPAVISDPKPIERYHVLETNATDVNERVELIVAKRPREEELPDYIALND